MKINATSSWGLGLKVVHRLAVEPTQNLAQFHKLAFAELAHHYQGQFHIEIDQSGKDLVRLCFLSHDPDVFFNPEAKPRIIKMKPVESNSPTSKYVREPKRSIDRRSSIKTADIIFILDDIIKFLGKEEKSITANYQDWIRIGFALKRILDETTGLGVNQLPTLA